MILPRFYDKIKGDIGRTSVAGATTCQINICFRPEYKNPAHGTH